MNTEQSIFIPADVPEKKHNIFTKNYARITRSVNRLFLFSCDHKIEHLNNDFYGPDINSQALHPEHLFRIASGGNIGAMATHLGLIARYAKQYPDINYIAKLNATTNIIQSPQQDPLSKLLWSVDDVITLRDNNKLNIPGVGITIYLGSEYESEHLAQASHIITQAHAQGLVTIVWIYPRGKAVSHENRPTLIAGAAGIAVSLGADFAKIKPPIHTETLTSSQSLKIACMTAGNSRIICSGEKKVEVSDYLETIYNQIHEGDTAGTATGRNIFQRPLNEAIALTHAISAIVYDNVDLKTSIALYNEKIAQKT